jgi:hypothetical protein
MIDAKTYICSYITFKEMKRERLILLTAVALAVIGLGSCGNNKAKEMVTT